MEARLELHVERGGAAKGVLDGFHAVLFGGWRHDDCDGHGRHEADISHAEALDALKEELEIELAHDVGLPARFKDGGVCARGDCGVEHGEGVEVHDVVGLSVSALIHEFVLRSEILVGVQESFWQSCRSGAEQARRNRCLAGVRVVEAGPVPLAVLHEVEPGCHAFGAFLLCEWVEDDRVRFRDPALRHGGLHGAEELWLDDHVLHLGGLERVGELVARVGWVRAGEDAAGGEDAAEEDRVVDIVEGVDAKEG